jgi:hypothetical protein
MLHPRDAYMPLRYQIGNLRFAPLAETEVASSMWALVACLDTEPRLRT